jgi:hypothetical protein
MCNGRKNHCHCQAKKKGKFSSSSEEEADETAEESSAEEAEKEWVDTVIDPTATYCLGFKNKNHYKRQVKDAPGPGRLS